MKRQTSTSLILRSSLVLALALTLGAPLQAQSAQHMAGKNTPDGKMMGQCQEMMEQKQKMMEEIKAQDAELAAQVAKMNSAPQGEKLDLVAAVVTDLAEQRIAMDARKAKMQEKMMQHMMQHMQMGKESMAQCPMMQGMGMQGMGMQDMGMQGMGKQGMGGKSGEASKAQQEK